MTLAYRAVWDDHDVEPVAALEEDFLAWCAEKGIADVEARRGVWVDGDNVVEVRRGDSEAGRVLRMSLTEGVREGRRWRTTATALADAADSTFWVDVECDAPEGARVETAAPRLVRNLLSLGSNPHRGPVILRAKTHVAVRATDVAPLAAAIYDGERDLALAVFSADRKLGPAQNQERADAAAATLAGIAGVHLLSPDATDEWNRVMPGHLRVWGGAVRLYLPGVDPDDEDDGFRHRWYRPLLFDRHPRRAGQILARRLALAGRWAEPPAVWNRLRHLVIRPDDAELATLVTTRRESVPAVADDELVQLRAEVEYLLEQAVLLEQTLNAEREEAEREIARLRSLNQELEDQILDDVTQMEELARERAGLLVALRHTRAEEPAVSESDTDLESFSPTSCNEAIEFARLYLKYVVVHDDAPRDVERLDEALKASVWAETLWQGLRALDLYARDVEASGSVGGFYEWCKRTAAWPVNKLTMVEGEPTMANERLRSMRMLPIDTAVDASGRIEMQAHLKIQSGGGNNIPRAYFHDDTGGITGKVHVGFIGPHDLMPNTKAN